jgi:hypothetical protein
MAGVEYGGLDDGNDGASLGASFFFRGIGTVRPGLTTVLGSVQDGIISWIYRRS